MDIEVVLFDLDGTLIRAGGAGARAMGIAFHLLFNKPKAFERVQFTGMTDPVIFKTGFQQAFGRRPSKDDMEKFFGLYLKVLKWEVAHAQRYRVLPGVRELITGLKEKEMKVGLATGNIMEGARIKLERADLWKEFGFGGFGSDSEDRVKLTGLAAARAFGGEEKIRKGSVLVVGDSPAEFEAARANGFKVALVATGWTPYEELEALHPDFMFRDFSNYKEAINEILGG